MGNQIELKKEEIREFTLCYKGGLMWLRYKPYKQAFIIDINPYDIAILMKNEGYKMELFQRDVELKFTQSVLVNTHEEEPVYGIKIVEDDDEEVFPPVCYVHKNSQ